MPKKTKRKPTHFCESCKREFFTTEKDVKECPLCKSEYTVFPLMTKRKEQQPKGKMTNVWISRLEKHRTMKYGIFGDKMNDIQRFLNNIAEEVMKRKLLTPNELETLRKEK